EVASLAESVTVGPLPYQPFARSGAGGETDALVAGATESSLTVSETGPEVRIGAALVVTEHASVKVPSVATGPSVQPVFVKAGAPKPCQVTVGALVYQPL